MDKVLISTYQADFTNIQKFIKQDKLYTYLRVLHFGIQTCLIIYTYFNSVFESEHIDNNILSVK